MDHATARHLPEEFLQSPGTSIERALSVVLHHWESYPTGEQRQLAQALVALLEPILTAPPGIVPETLREECARTIGLWEARWASLRERPKRAVKFVSVEIEQLPNNRCRGSAQLERATGGFYRGMAELPGTDVVACAAHAAADAVCQALSRTSPSVVVEQTATVEIFGKRGVSVKIAARHRGQLRSLVGFCLITGDPARAGALAVLNAANRFLNLD